MPEASGQSKRELLERLIADLRLLRPDAREREFEKWRAGVNATMSDLFGPRHRLTLDLRAVTFTPDFGQGRARALAILRAASNLATTPPKSKAETARPAATAEPAPASSGLPAAAKAARPVSAAVPDRDLESSDDGLAI